MAERRMFARTIIDSDAFLDMSASAQALYFHLSMRADDDGFVNNPKKIQRMIGSADDDLKILIAKRFVLVFQSGVLVIKHWRMHNYIQNDRYKPTPYQEEKALLKLDGNNAYTEITAPDTPCIQSVSKAETQVRLGKDSIGKDSIGYTGANDAPDGKPSCPTQDDSKDISVSKRPRKAFAPPTIDDVKAYCAERNNTINAERWLSYYESNGWMVGRNKMKDWKAAIRTWEANERGQGKPAGSAASTRPGKEVGAHRYEQREYTQEETEALAVDLFKEARNLKEPTE